MKGLTIVYTGNGKGKTTAALGLALRAVGHGKKVLIIQFLKKGEFGEIKAIKRWKQEVRSGKWEIRQYGSGDFVDPKNLKKIDYSEAVKALGEAKSETRSGKWEMLILDEVNVAVKFGLIKLNEILDLVKEKSSQLDLVLTGRWADSDLIKTADLVTEFVEIKHPYSKGGKSRAGVEY